MRLKSDQKDIYWAAFLAIGVGGKKKLEKIKSTFDNLGSAWEWFASIKNLNSNQNKQKNALKKIISEEKLEVLGRKISAFSLEKFVQKIKRNKIGILPYYSPCYPKKLAGISGAPPILYYAGDPSVLKTRSLAVVGTRKISPYGERCVEQLLPELIKRKITIVSGLARGVDILSHKCALKMKGKTIAVLAGGLDIIYPPANKKYAKEIVCQKGALVSEYPPGTPYLKQNFPARNRIISGLSEATLVIEAGSRSGALFTANFAKAQNRKVFAVPGSIFSQVSVGTNSLINNGAQGIVAPFEVVDYYFATKKGKVDREKRINTSSKINTSNLNKEEKSVLELLNFDAPILINQIISKNKLPAEKVISIISQLELLGLVKAVSGKSYVRCI